MQNKYRSLSRIIVAFLVSILILFSLGGCGGGGASPGSTNPPANVSNGGSSGESADTGNTPDDNAGSDTTSADAGNTPDDNAGSDATSADAGNTPDDTAGSDATSADTGNTPDDTAGSDATSADTGNTPDDTAGSDGESADSGNTSDDNAGSDSASADDSSDMAAPNKILLLGDSITHGYLQKSYRYELWKKLVDAGVSFDFLGTMKTSGGYTGGYPDYQGKTFDPDHEGHGGFHSEGIQANLDTWLQQYDKPDTVLLHIGTNDVLNRDPTTPVKNAIEGIITKLKDRNPNVIILVARIIPTTGFTWFNGASIPLESNIDIINDRYVERLNTSIDDIIFQYSDPSIMSVDMYTDFSTSFYLFDGVHPNETGEAILAQRWRDALFVAGVF